MSRGARAHVAAGSSGATLAGLPPILGPRTRVLVLGSFPGAASLAAQQYYAHPQNQFWHLMGDLLGQGGLVSSRACYKNRIDALQAAGIGIWDVYARCRREGSLDSAIRAAELNDFSRIVPACPQLALIAHNGAASHRHHGDVASAWRAAGLVPPRGVRLPSTSPAHARLRLGDKCVAWREALASAGLALGPAATARHG